MKMDYDELLEMRDRVERRVVTPQTLKILNENPEQRKLWEEELNSLNKEVMNSNLSPNYKEIFLKSINEYKNSIKKEESKESALEKYFPYLIVGGACLVFGYLLRGGFDFAKDFFSKSLAKGFYEEMKKGEL